MLVFSRQDVCDDAASDAGQARVQSLEFYVQALVINAKQMQHRRVEIRNRDRILLSRVAEFISGSISDAGLDAATGNEKRKALDVMIASIATLRHRCASE